MFPNAIIAGTNKAGTTSLFRYLSDHPDVCISKKKEIGFFSSFDNDIEQQDLDQYQQYFSHCSATKKIILEASPVYLTRADIVAKHISQHLPNAKLIFILREPTARLLSHFKRRRERQFTGLEEMDLNHYLDVLTDVDQNPNTTLHNEALKKQAIVSLNSVKYVQLLPPFLDKFNRDQMHITFFDDLAQRPQQFTQTVCKFLKIDDSFYDDYSFAIENRARAYRFRNLQQLAFNINMKLEPVLNQSPKLRKFLRDSYNKFNESKSPQAKGEISVEKLKQLKSLFTDVNSDLGRLLSTYYPDISLPDWVTSTSPESKKPQATDRPS